LASFKVVPDPIILTIINSGGEEAHDSTLAKEITLRKENTL
jgi:hypothetical protein